jgi:hypothetical protein
MSDEVTNESVDQIYNDVMSPASSDIPMSQDAPKSEFTFTANGKEINANKDEVLKWASQGHDYSQKMQEFKTQREEFDTTSARYKEIDEYATANPDWFEHVEQAYKNRDNTQGDSSDEEKSPELQRIEAVEQFINETKAAKQFEARQEEDKLLDMEVKSIREQYPNLDWNSKDEKTGHTLEMKVMNHAQTIGTNSFRAAFRDHMHDNLINGAKETGKELVSQDLAKKTKLGLLGQSPTPTQGITKAVNHKNKSYDDLTNEALDELGIT